MTPNPSRPDGPTSRPMDPNLYLDEPLAGSSRPQSTVLPGGIDLAPVEDYARRSPLPALAAAAALGYLMSRTGLASSPIRATGLALGATTDLAGGAIRGTANLAGETVKGAGSLAGGAIGALAPLATGVLGAGAHLGGGVLGAGKDITVGTARAGWKLSQAVLTLLPTVAALYAINAFAGQGRTD